MSHQNNFFYSNLFIAIVTLLVGAFGFLLYFLCKSDFKRRTARIIYLEITNAESKLKDAQSRIQESDRNNSKNLPEHLYAMPINTWTRNRHLFVNNFKPNEWESINSFYDKCELYDEAIRSNDSRFSKDEQEIRQNVHKANYEMSEEYANQLKDNMTDEEGATLKAKLKKHRDALAQFLTDGSNIWIYTPSKEVNDVEFILKSTNLNLSLSSVGTRLNQLSKLTSWHRKRQ
jgi:hypothetical protein